MGLQASGMPMHSRSKVHAALISSKRCRSLGLSWPTATPRILGELRSAHSRAKINKSPEQRSLSGPMSSTSKRMPIQPADRDFPLLCLLPIKPASSRPPRHSVLPHTMHRHWTGNCPTNRPPWVHPKDQDMKPSSSAIMAVTKHPPSFTLSGPQGRHEAMVLTFRRHLCRPTLSLGGDTQPELKTTGPLHYIQLASDSWSAGTRECGEWNGEFLSSTLADFTQHNVNFSRWRCLYGD